MVWHSSKSLALIGSIQELLPMAGQRSRLGAYLGSSVSPTYSSVIDPTISQLKILQPLEPLHPPQQVAPARPHKFELFARVGNP